MATREARLARTFVEVADTLVADFDVVDLHTLLADRCVEIFAINAAGVMVVAPDGSLRVTASSNEAAKALELFELQAEEGPCYDCFHSGRPIINQDLATVHGRWPRFAPTALGHGFSTAHALPMRLRDEVIGALNLFQITGRLEQQDFDGAQALADIATIAILHHRAGIQAQLLNDQLDQALTSRIVIEQAKGMLAALGGMTMDGAFNSMRAYARGSNRRLSDVARDVTDGTLTIADVDLLRP
ncbi:MAG: GAF and ANTAR domain-containing protein [Acidimicrobiales bacterium]